MTSSSRLVSEIVKLDVGSSMMTMRASSDSALAISSSWRWAIERSATEVSGAKSQPSRSSSGADIGAQAAPVDEPKRTARTAARVR